MFGLMIKLFSSSSENSNLNVFLPTDWIETFFSGLLESEKKDDSDIFGVCVISIPYSYCKINKFVSGL